MSSRIFVDTLFVIALINRRDQHHQQAVERAEQFDGHPLLVTDAVLLEIGNALARSYKQEAAEIIEQYLTAEEVEVVHLTPRLFRASLRALQNPPRQGVGVGGLPVIHHHA